MNIGSQKLSACMTMAIKNAIKTAEKRQGDIMQCWQNSVDL